jgi:dolichol-phosphate mannosyltransferase
MKRLQLSFVIPCYNEAECLPTLYRRTADAARAEVGDDFEIVLVNDGSSDGSWPAMKKLAAADPNVLAINLSRNHGHQLALTAGLDLCCGEQILIIDADLQDPPELVRDMRALMNRENADVVYAVRRRRAGDSVFKRASAAGFYRLLYRLTETEIPMDTGDFRLMSRRALDALLSMPEQTRFIRGMVAWVGFRQVPILYDRDERFAGTTKYPLRKMIRFAFDALTSFSITPLRFASHLGLGLTALSLMMAIYVLFNWLIGSTVEGWASTILIVLLIGAAQMFVLGMIGEYLGRLYIEVKRRPLYLVADIAGGDPTGGRLGYRAHSPAIDYCPRKDADAQGSVANVASDSPIGR